MPTEPPVITALRNLGVNLDGFDYETPTLDDDYWDVAITYSGADADDDRTSIDRLAALIYCDSDCGPDFTLDHSPYTDVPVLYVTAR